MQLQIDKINEMTIVECDGGVVTNDAAFELRDVVISQRDARIIVVDLLENWPIRSATWEPAFCVLLKYQTWKPDSWPWKREQGMTMANL